MRDESEREPSEEAAVGDSSEAAAESPSGDAGGRSGIEGMPEEWLDAVPAVPMGDGDVADALADAGPGPHDASRPLDDSGVSQGSRVMIGTGQSGIVAPSDIVAEDAVPGGSNAEHMQFEGMARDVEFVADDRPENESPDVDPGVGDEWRDIAPAGPEETPSESVGFGAFLSAQEVIDHGGASDSFAGDSQGLAGPVGETIEIVAPIVAAKAAAPKRGGALGQIVGVLLGGLLAIPVTMAILVWGFQRDPLGVAKSVPEGMRFLLPAALRGGAGPRPRSGGGSGPTLDSIARLSPPEQGLSPAGERDAPTPPTDDPPAPSAELVATGVSAAGESPSDVGASAVETTVDAVAVPVEPGATPSQPDAAATVTPPLEEIPLTVPSPLPSAPAPEASAPDLGELDAAVRRGVAATEALRATDPSMAPELREPMLVAWYRDLADAAARLAAAERAYADAGMPASAVSRRFDELSRSLGTDMVEELSALGAMWLTAARRPSDGVVLAGILEESRPVGPWWWGSVSVESESAHRVSFFSRSAPSASPGAAVLVAGVLADPATMWACDIRPVAATPDPVPATTDGL